MTDALTIPAGSVAIDTIVDSVAEDGLRHGCAYCGYANLLDDQDNDAVLATLGYNFGGVATWTELCWVPTYGTFSRHFVIARKRGRKGARP